MQSLVCVQVTLSAASLADDPVLEELFEDALWQTSPAGVERQDDETWSELVEDPSPRAAGDVRWRLYFDGESVAPDDARDAAAAAIGELPGTLEVWRIDDLSFLERWREHFKPAQVSDRIMVHPPWEVPSVGDDVVLVCIDPGMAFGTGTHETTRLCLRALDVALDAGARSVLDVGTGSAILAIAAAKLGAGPIVAIDNDTVAVAVARENIEHNGLDGAIEASATPLADLDGTWDLVLANILPHVLVALRDDLLARVAPGGRVVLSGIIERELQGVADAFADPAFDEVEREVMGEWCSLTLARR